MPNFEFDPVKDQINQKKHGISFLQAQALWEGDHIIVPAKNLKEEHRYLLLGTLGRKIYLAVYTIRDDKIRLISCHRADKKWEKYYEEKIEK